MNLTLISDTHGAHTGLGTLEGDVLIHCGDFAAPFDGDGTSVADLDEWFGRQRFDRILYTGGNHDFFLQRLLETDPQPLRNAIYLEDALHEFRGVAFYGAPWTPFLPGFAFYRDNESLRRIWAQIPEHVDVLFTHTPPMGILDTPRGRAGPSGDPHLLARVRAVRPKLHAFGHIHAGYGSVEIAGTRFVNAALGGEDEGGPGRPPVMVTI